MTQLPDADRLPELSEIFETFTPTIKFIMPAVCTEWSRVLGGVLDRLAADPGNVSLWKHLYMSHVAGVHISGERAAGQAEAAAEWAALPSPADPREAAEMARGGRGRPLGGGHPADADVPEHGEEEAEPEDN